LFPACPQAVSACARPLPLAPCPPPAAVGPVLPATGALSYSGAGTCPAARWAASRWNAQAGRGCAGQLSHGPRRHVMSQNLIDLSLDAERLGRLDAALAAVEAELAGMAALGPDQTRE